MKDELMKSPPDPESINALAEMSLFLTSNMTERMSLESELEAPVNVMAETLTGSTVGAADAAGGARGDGSSMMRGSEGGRLEKSTPGKS